MSTRERQEQSGKGDLVDAVAALGNGTRRLGETQERMKRNPDRQIHEDEENGTDQRIGIRRRAEGSGLPPGLR